MPWRRPAPSTLQLALKCSGLSPISTSEQGICCQIIREATIHELESPVSLAPNERTSELDKLCNQPTFAGNCRVLRIPGVQHPGIVLPVMACMSRNCDCVDVFGSRVRNKKKAYGRTLAITNCLLGASLSLELHTLVDLVPVERKTSCR